jgi:hypothetical protein
MKHSNSREAASLLADLGILCLFMDSKCSLGHNAFIKPATGPRTGRAGYSPHRHALFLKGTFQYYPPMQTSCVFQSVVFNLHFFKSKFCMQFVTSLCKWGYVPISLANYLDNN